MNVPVQPGQQDRYTVLDTAPRRLRDFLLSWDVILVILFVLTIVVNSLVSPYFLDVYNLIPPTEAMLGDNIHLTRSGEQRLAELLADRMSDLLMN